MTTQRVTIKSVKGISAEVTIRGPVVIGLDIDRKHVKGWEWFYTADELGTSKLYSLFESPTTDDLCRQFREWLAVSHNQRDLGELRIV